MANGRIPVSVNGGDLPRWSADGKQILYRRGTDLMAVDVRQVGQGLELGTPRVVVGDEEIVDFDVAPDGRGILTITMNRTPLTVITNWTRLLE